MIIASNPPIDLPLEQMNDDQKWKVFQFLWKDVVEGHEAEIEPPAWHEEILQERLDKEARDEAVWRSVDETFDMIRKEVAHGR
jgi:hypothetical protein